MSRMGLPGIPSPGRRESIHGGFAAASLLPKPGEGIPGNPVARSGGQAMFL